MDIISLMAKVVQVSLSLNYLVRQCRRQQHSDQAAFDAAGPGHRKRQHRLQSQRTAKLCRKVMRRGLSADTGKREVSNVKRPINSTVRLNKYAGKGFVCVSVAAPQYILCACSQIC